MDYRTELKLRVSMADYALLRTRLRYLMSLDPHSDENGIYLIRSLYFDNLQDKALREKLDGVDIREKFRIRVYNGDESFIRLEKKSKRGGLGNKRSAVLTPEEAQSILASDWQAIGRMRDPLVLELAAKMKSEGLRPRTLVQYRREAYVYPAGNVRVTFDTDLRTGLFSTDLFAEDLPMITPLESVALLEIKYDAFLPGDVYKRQLIGCILIWVSLLSLCPLQQ